MWWYVSTVWYVYVVCGTWYVVVVEWQWHRTQEVGTSMLYYLLRTTYYLLLSTTTSSTIYYIYSTMQYVVNLNFRSQKQLEVRSSQQLAKVDVEVEVVVVVVVVVEGRSQLEVLEEVQRSMTRKQSDKHQASSILILDE